MSIWTETTSRYGSYPSDTKNISKSTAYRWAKENRTKNRKAKALRSA